MTAPTDGAPPPSEWLPVADAAAAARVPIRSLYRWTEKKRVPTRTENGVMLVDVAAVRAYAARRAAKRDGGTPARQVGTNADNGSATWQVNGTDRAPGIEASPPRSTTKPTPTVGSRVTSATVNDAELAAEVFAAFEDGDTPLDVAMEMRIPSEQVRALHREWADLRSLGGGGGPSLADRVSALEKQLKETQEASSMQMFGMEGMASDALNRVYVLEQQVASMPLPSAQDFTCPSCRAHGLLAATASCGHCRTAFTFGPRR